MGGLLAAVSGYSQIESEPVRIFDFHRYDGMFSLQWEGGFPPYRIQLTPKIGGRWIDLPELIRGNSYTGVAPTDALFFAVRTEYPAIELIEMHEYGPFTFIQWSGGVPPFKVQVRNHPDDPWSDLAPPNRHRFNAFQLPEPLRLFRVVSETDNTPPLAPGNFQILAALCERAVLSWDEADDGAFGSGIRAYHLYYEGELIVRLPASARFLMQKNLVPGTSYKYHLTALDNAGNESAPSQPQVFTATGCPFDLDEPGQTSVVLEWDASEDVNVSGYMVYWGTEPGRYSNKLDALTATTATVPELQIGTAYFFSVAAYNVFGGESERCDEIAWIPAPTE